MDKLLEFFKQIFPIIYKFFFSGAEKNDALRKNYRKKLKDFLSSRNKK